MIVMDLNEVYKIIDYTYILTFKILGKIDAKHRNWCHNIKDHG